MRTATKNAAWILMALTGACAFYASLAGWAAGGFPAVLSDAADEAQRSQTAQSSEPHPGLRDDELKEALRGDWQKKHRQLGYYQARKALFGEIDGNGRKAEGLYTGETISYFRQPLPNKGLMDHAWSVTRLPAEARTDLHHLYPVIPEARGARANFHYGKVVVAVWSRGGSKSGPSSKVVPVFQPRQTVRGDIARAMFYVSTMYDRDIPAGEEKRLKRWHRDDPPSRAEKRRNKAVAGEQGSVNPFIKYPNLVERIGDF